MGLESMISSVATTEGLIADDDGSSLIDFDKKITDTRFLENEFYYFLPEEPVQDSSKVSSISLNLCIVLLLLQLLIVTSILGDSRTELPKILVFQT